MNLERIPRWLKAFAASLWAMFVLAPLGAWLMHQYGDRAIWLAARCAMAFFLFYRGQCDDDLPDAEYYRRKAALKTEC